MKGIYQPFLLQIREIWPSAAVEDNTSLLHPNNSIFITPQHQANCIQIFQNKKLLYLYRDPAYRATFGVTAPYKGHTYLNAEQLNSLRLWQKYESLLSRALD